MFFAPEGMFEPCGMFTWGHVLLLSVTAFAIIRALQKTVDLPHEEILKIIRGITAVMWILEIVKISWRFAMGDASRPETWIPLYYCSIFLYAGLCSSFGKGFIRKCGDTFIATGCLIGGAAFLLYPSTSLPQFPVFHFLSLHSFLYHGSMVYLSLLLNLSGYCVLRKKDQFAATVLPWIASFAALGINRKLRINLMFIMEPLKGSATQIFLTLFGSLYTPVITALQVILPFWAVWWLRGMIAAGKNRQEKESAA